MFFMALLDAAIPSQDNSFEAGSPPFTPGYLI